MLSHEERFYVNLLGFSDFLISLNEEYIKNGYEFIDTNYLLLLKIAIEKMDKVSLIKMYVDNSKDKWESVRLRDEKALKDTLSMIYSKIPITIDSKFLTILDAKDSTGKRIISDADLNLAWDYITSLTKIAIKWCYQQDPSKEMNNLVRIWNIKL